MARKITDELLLGFAEEVREYLPIIEQAAKSTDTVPAEVFQTAYRYCHTIKGASAMCGLTTLSHVANFLEEVCEDLGSKSLKSSRNIILLLKAGYDAIETCINALPGRPAEEDALLRQVHRRYRRARKFPVKDDEIAFEQLFAQVTPVSPEPAASPRSTWAEEIKLDDPSSIDPEFAAIFAEEAEDNIQSIYVQMVELENNPAQAAAQKELRRLVHNLKGAAATVGYMAPSQLAHRLEDLMDAVCDGGRPITRDEMQLLYSGVDVLQDLSRMAFDADAMRSTLADLYGRFAAQMAQGVIGGDMPAESINAQEDDSDDVSLMLAPAAEQGRVGSDSAEEAEPETATAAVEATPRAPREIELPEFVLLDRLIAARTAAMNAPATEIADTAASSPETSGAAPAVSGDSVRLRIDQIDEMVKLVGEQVVARTTFEQQMLRMQATVDELRRSLSRLRSLSTRLDTEYETKMLGGQSAFDLPAGQIPSNLSRRFQISEFDELEFDRYTEFHLISRSLAETANDIHSVGGELGNLIGDFESSLNRQEVVTRDLQDRLMKARMVPLGSLTSRLRRVVRNAATTCHKEVELEMAGEGLHLDKTVIESLVDPLTHILRNAVDHGIETGELRQERNKPAVGTVRIAAFHEGTHAVLKVSDDGAGLNADAIREAAIQRGLIEANAVLADRDIHQLIFSQGLSTARSVSEISGRGVGMDVVQEVIQRLKGTVLIDSTPGQGVTFTIRLPLTMAITRALIVDAGGAQFAIPMQEVTQIARISQQDLGHIGTSTVLRVGDRVLPLQKLTDILHLTATHEDLNRSVPVLFLQTGSQTTALAVDRIQGAREIVVKPLGSHLRRVHGLIGATFLGDGTVIPILNPSELLQVEARPAHRKVTSTKSSQIPQRPYQIMIVDDSVSVRRVAANLIQHQGWVAITARDGVEAFEILQRDPQRPDLVLLDVEMPRMDGFELLSTLRGLPQFSDLPIVMVTSRSGNKHQGKADELGATDYVIKPFDEDRLIALIHKHVRSVRERVLV
jgi:chemosensory pili system protein ChpA (sensor histidine kinase/response regulator)